MSNGTIEQRRLYGGKAAALLELAASGFNVPKFVVSPDSVELAAQQLGWPLAVRSSATAEDGRWTSFAGQFESYLNLTTIDSVEEAIAACRESVQRPEVIDYCRHHGIDPKSIRMECIVQRMVKPVLAGVVFTLNPVTGADEIVIEACAGVADQMLAGHVTPLPDDDARLQRYRELIEMTAREIERRFGLPQDIEFAIADDQISILQARPITRISFTSESSEWTNADFRDGGVSSSVCSPLMWSLYELVWNHALKSSLAEVKLLEDDFVAGKMFFGRPYWNLGAVKKCVSRIPGYCEREFDADLNIEPRYGGDGVRTPLTPRTLWNVIPTVWGIRRFLDRQTQAAQATLERGWDHYASRFDPATLQLDEQFRELITTEYFELETTYFRTIFALSMAKLEFKLAYPQADYAGLVANLPELSHMASLGRIRQMAETATVDVDQLIREFPHLSRHGLDIIHARWDEDHEFVQHLVQQLVLDDAPFEERKPATDRAAFEQQLVFWRRPGFRRKLARLRRLVWLREELRDLSSRMYHLIRQHVLEIARRRLLGSDVFFMTFEEIFADDRSGIEARRDDYERFRNFDAPPEIGTRFTHDAAIRGAVLAGLPASSGRVTGRAHVAANIDEALEAPIGSVLVCPFTEPSWTPVLGRVAGVVTETGGQLSHAAVICREYSIPAVLGVPAATTRLRTGQWVTLDGATGQIELTSDSATRNASDGVECFKAS